MKKIYICIMGTLFSLSLLTACSENNEKDEKIIESSDTLDLKWYSEKDAVKKSMSNYTMISESEEIGLAGEMQTLLEYSGTNLYEQPCDVTLCLTSIGLIGINYHDLNGQYDQWVERITNSYGEPTEISDFGMASWENDPIGIGTSIYVLYTDNDVQISFFADETGSETVPQ